MTYENIVGLQVDNDETYAQYRRAMLPILERFGGGFRYDFKISEVLKSETESKINRVFIIYFPDKESKEKFFDNPDYKIARQQFFEPSVSAVTILAEYERYDE